nr:MAG: RecT family protein [Bacteriophage sp.]
MALTRSGAPAPTSSVSNAQALANRSVQNANRAGSTAMQAASPSVPVEITAADGQHFTVSFGEVRSFICPQATDAECKIFLETCKQYHLNPFTKEAYLIHYDNKNADTASTIVLGKNCYLQMAERNPAYDGFEAGVVVLDTAVGELIHREGSLVFDGEELLGGWAKVYRKDRTRASYEEVKLSEYDTGKSLWNGKKATMIRKVALVHALREAFPSTFGALYDESEVRVDAESTAREVPPEELPVLDPYAGSHRHRKTAGTLIPAPEAPAEEPPADDPFGGDDA